MYKKKLLLLVLVSLSVVASAKETVEIEGPLPFGNFAVPAVTEIAPLISFGQLLIGENALLAQVSGFRSQSHHGHFNAIAPNVIYGIRDDMSLFFTLPITFRNKEGHSHSSGLADALLQYEYAYYTRTRKEYTLQATVVANVQFPTGSMEKVPPTGNGWFSYFLGTTFAYMSRDWYAFISPGANFPTSHHGTKAGNSYLYQWGFARYIEALSPPGCIFDLMIEFDGTYSQKNRRSHKEEPDSGGNVLLATPSFWLSSESWLIQSGVSFPIFQNLNGHQDKIEYEISYVAGLAFQF
jgi:hypothetical protein